MTNSLPIYSPGGESDFKVDNLYRWATVTDTAPLRVRLDGDTEGLPVTPDTLVDPFNLRVGDRVYLQFYGRRVIVLGKGKGTPPPVEVLAITDNDPEFVYSSVGWQIASSAVSDTPTIVADGRHVTIAGRIKYTTAALTLGTVYQPMYLPIRFAPSGLPRAQLAVFAHNGAQALGPAMGCWIDVSGGTQVRVNLLAATGQSSWGSGTWIYFGGSWIRDIPVGG